MLSACVVAAFCATFTPAAQISLVKGASLPGEVVRYWNVEDATIDSSFDELNLGGSAYLNGGAGKAILIRFGDLRRALGSRVAIKSAKLRLTMTGPDNPRLSGVSQLLVPWNEGPSQVVNFRNLNARAQKAAPGSATYRWRRAGDPPIPWQGIGASGLSESKPIAGVKGEAIGAGKFEISGIETAIQQSYDDPFESGGIELRFDANCEFFSSQAPDGRPELVVETSPLPASSAPDLSVILIARSPWPQLGAAATPEIAQQDGENVAVYPAVEASPSMWPKSGEMITYTATVRNEGGSTAHNLRFRWSSEDRWGAWNETSRQLEPGATTEFAFQKPYKPNAIDHRFADIAIQVASSDDDANLSNNGLDTPESGIDLSFTLPTSGAATSSRGSSAEDAAQALVALINRTFLPYSRFSFAADGARERFFVQSFRTDSGGIPVPLNGNQQIDALKAALRQAGVIAIEGNVPPVEIPAKAHAAMVRRPQAIEPNVFGGGDSRFDGAAPTFLQLPADSGANPLFDAIFLESTGLLAATEVYALESRLGVRSAQPSDALYDQPPLLVFKATSMEGRSLNGSPVRAYATTASGKAIFIQDLTADASGAFQLKERPAKSVNPRLRPGVFGRVDVLHPNEGLLFEIVSAGKSEFAYLPAWRVTDIRARAGIAPAVIDLRFNVSNGAIEATNLALNRLVVDSANSLPAKLSPLVDGSIATACALPSGSDGWIEIDLGRDRVIGEIDLVATKGACWNDFEILGYNTGQTAAEATTWRRERRFDWSLDNLGEPEAGQNVARYRAQGRQFRYIRLRNRGPQREAKLSELRVYGVASN